MKRATKPIRVTTDLCSTPPGRSLTNCQLLRCVQQLREDRMSGGLAAVVLLGLNRKPGRGNRRPLLYSQESSESIQSLSKSSPTSSIL